jgi:endonuclease YncB( thermonuclease family)
MVNKIHSLKQILKLTPFLLCLLIFNLILSFAHAETHRVERVIGGDTLMLSDGQKVRLIGVDTPETKHPQKPV